MPTLISVFPSTSASTQARFVDVWGLAEVAGILSAEASEEMGHAERIISRTQSINSNGLSNCSTLVTTYLKQSSSEVMTNGEQ